MGCAFKLRFNLRLKLHAHKAWTEAVACYGSNTVLHSEPRRLECICNCHHVVFDCKGQCAFAGRRHAWKTLMFLSVGALRHSVLTVHAALKRVSVLL